MAKRLLAKEVNAAIQEDLAVQIAALKEKDIIPTLATVRVGESGADISYEIGATKRLKALELGVRNVVLPPDISQEKLIHTLEALSADPEIHGILLFQPLPARMDAIKVKQAISPEKDVDCATIENLGGVLMGNENCFAYCAPTAVIELLDHYNIPVEGKFITIVGSGLVVGKTLSVLLVNRNATVAVCNVYTKDTFKYTKQADIVVSACGVAGLIDDTYVSSGQIVIDVGTTYKNGKLVGDVNIEAVDPIVEALTPTPGGISSITNLVLAKHVVQAAMRITK